MNTETELTIKIVGEEILRKKAEDVTEFGKPLRELADNMYKIMKKSKGIGLAAPQVGVSIKFFIVDIEQKKNSKIEIANPEIIYKSDDEEIMEEGCLSVPGVYADVVRPKSIVVRGYNVEGEQIEITASGLIARALLHENDHLLGTLFIDYLSENERERISPAIKKLKKTKH